LSAVILGAAVAGACGKDSSGPSARVATVTAIAGDSQVGSLGQQLEFALSFTVLDSTGHPIRGVSVPWTVSPAGGATFAPQTSTSDGNGVVATQVRLGADTGVLTITANVPNVAPVVFHVLSLDPCLFGIALPIPGATVNAALRAGDCNRGGWYYDYYLLDTPAGQTNLRVSMASDTFDTWIDVYVQSDGSYAGFDDDIIRAVNTNSQFDAVLPEASWVIGANSYDPASTGPYVLSTSIRSFALNGCREVWVVGGVSVTDTLKTTDCADSTAMPRRYEVARIWADASTALTFAVHSTAMNPMLTMYRLETNYSRTLIATNDDSIAGFTNAYLPVTVAQSAPYDILISTSAPGELGAYTLDVTAVPPASAPARVTRSAWERMRALRAITAERTRLPRWPKPLPLRGGRR
jgi:hypothetical protein